MPFVLKILCMKKRSLILLCGLLANAVLFTACNDDDDDMVTPPVTERDKAFMVQASYGNYNEVELAALADSISTNDSIDVFADMMLTDHQASQADLVALSNNWNVSIPHSPDSLHLAQRAQLLLLTGYSFDTAYIRGQIRDHEQAVALFQFAADSSKVGSVRTYASKYLPKVRMHLEHAQRINASLQQ